MGTFVWFAVTSVQKKYSAKGTRPALFPPINWQIKEILGWGTSRKNHTATSDSGFHMCVNINTSLNYGAPPLKSSTTPKNHQLVRFNWTKAKSRKIWFEKTGYPISFYTLKILYLVIDRKKILFLANNLVYIL